MTEITSRPCAQCGMAFEPRTSRTVICSERCRRQRYRDPVKHRANNRASAKKRSTEAGPRPCEGCGTTFVPTAKASARFCTAACAGIQQSKWNRIHWPASRIWIASCSCGLARVFRTQKRTWTCGSCAEVGPPPRRCTECGTTYRSPQPAQRYCSPQCSRRRHGHDAKARRRAQSRSGGEPAARMRIYERDGWRCQICGRKVKRNATVPDPRAPTLDHIIPLAAGGTHEPANVQCACFICNARKGDRGTDQLLLFG